MGLRAGLQALTAGAALGCAAGSALAGTLQITSYDIMGTANYGTETPNQSWGDNTYTGTKTYISEGIYGHDIYNYEGGSGYLNDGSLLNWQILTGDSHLSDRYFSGDLKSITLHFDGLYVVESFSFMHGWEDPLSSVNVTIGGLSESISTGSQKSGQQSFGDLTSSHLSSIVTNQITFSMFVNGGIEGPWFSLSEINVSGTMAPPPVPLPAAAPMLVSALAIGGLIALRRKRA